MKNTFLVFRNMETKELVVATKEEWDVILKTNRTLPREKRRFFIKDVFDDCGEIDCMYIETSREEYEKWHSEYQVAQSKRKCGADFTSVSLSEPCSTARGIVLEDTISDGFDLEKEVIDRLLIEELRHALKKWNDWAPDLFDYYLAGKYSTCTKELIEKWGVSKPIVAKRKRQLNAFIKNYLA